MRQQVGVQRWIYSETTEILFFSFCVIFLTELKTFIKLIQSSPQSFPTYFLLNLNLNLKESPLYIIHFYLWFHYRNQLVWLQIYGELSMTSLWIKVEFCWRFSPHLNAFFMSNKMSENMIVKLNFIDARQ